MTCISTSPKNIIIRMPNWLGDVVMATPIIQDTKTYWPNATLTVMCQTNMLPLLKEDPYINEIFTFDRPSAWLHRIQERNLINRLKKGHYDLGILLTNSFSSAWWFWRGKIKNRIGFKGNFRNLFLQHKVSFPKNKEIQHQVLTYKSLLFPLGIPLSETKPKLYISQNDLKDAHELLSVHGVKKTSILIGINPSSAYGPAKCWLPERFQEVTTKLLANPNIHVIYFGDQASKPSVNQICKGLPKRVINLAGLTSLSEFMALIMLCNVFLTNDSGPMHLASAIGTPLLALFGSTSDIKTGPYEGGKILHKRVECSPCYKRTCPIDFKCMTSIETEEVYEEIEKLINSI